MSHIVTVRTQVRDPQAIQSACSRLKLPAPVYGAAKLFVGEKTGWAVKLTGWMYPVVCNTNTGELNFDNYGGKWGQQRELDLFLQAYAVERAKMESRKAGHTATAVKSEAVACWRDQTLPYVEPGIRLVRRNSVATLESKLRDAQVELRETVKNLDRCWGELVDQARKRLGDLFDVTD